MGNHHFLFHEHSIRPQFLIVAALFLAAAVSGAEKPAQT